MATSLFSTAINVRYHAMESSPVITHIVFEPSPRSDAGAADIGWPPSPDLVEASDEIIWSDNNHELICPAPNSSPL
jgi:hypothetical protein